MFLFKTNIFIPEDHLQSPAGRKISCVRCSPGTEQDLLCAVKSSEGRYMVEGFPAERQTTVLIVGNTGPREVARQGNSAGGE